MIKLCIHHTQPITSIPTLLLNVTVYAMSLSSRLSCQQDEWDAVIGQTLPYEIESRMQVIPRVAWTTASLLIVDKQDMEVALLEALQMIIL